jgi:ATP-dependent Clp protease ATP-binding subunit ClpA
MAKAIKSLTKNKAQNVLTIDTNLINKEEVFRMLSLARATEKPVLLVGPPGTGKTKTVIDFAKAWLLKDVPPGDVAAMKKAQQEFMEKIYILETDEGTKSSEVKGLPDMAKLFGAEPRYEIIAPITEAEIVIINEVDKASSNIRNSLLSIMNEKFLFNGKHKIPCKWKLFIATCNEIPKEEAGSPFWDRFLLKMQVNRISAGDMIRYYDRGAKEYKETMKIGLPTRAEMEGVTIPTSKLEKFLNVAYNRCSDRTLTFVPELIKAVSFVWDYTLDKSMVKVATIMIDSEAGNQLAAQLMNQEMKALMSKADMLWSLHDAQSVDEAVAEIDALLTGYASAGKLDQSQVEEVEAVVAHILEGHPVKQKEKEIEDLLEDVLTTQPQAATI